MRADARLDGHIVQGHVDGTGRVRALERARRRRAPRASTATPSSRDCLVDEGLGRDRRRLADGGRRVGRAGFDVALIPHTLAVTTLGERRRRRPREPRGRRARRSTCAATSSACSAARGARTDRARRSARASPLLGAAGARAAAPGAGAASARHRRHLVAPRDGRASTRAGTCGPPRIRCSTRRCCARRCRTSGSSRSGSHALHARRRLPGAARCCTGRWWRASWPPRSRSFRRAGGERRGRRAARPPSSRRSPGSGWSSFAPIWSRSPRRSRSTRSCSRRARPDLRAALPRALAAAARLGATRTRSSDRAGAAARGERRARSARQGSRASRATSRWRARLRGAGAGGSALLLRGGRARHAGQSTRRRAAPHVRDGSLGRLDLEDPRRLQALESASRRRATGSPPSRRSPGRSRICSSPRASSP